MKKIICMIITCMLVSTSLIGLLFTTAFADANDWTIGNGRITEEVKALVIDSAEVDIILKTGKDSEILIEEQSSTELSEDRKVRWQLDGTTLRIKYNESFWNIFSFLLGDVQRSLTVTIPEDLVLDSLEVYTASADLTTDTLQANTAAFTSASGDKEIILKGEMEKVTFSASSGDTKATLETVKQVQADASSGNIAVTLESAENIQADTSSGDIFITTDSADQVKTSASSGTVNISVGSAKQVTSGTSSGDVTINMTSAENVNVDTASGDVTFILPENADVTVNYSTASGDLTSELPMAMNGNAYTSGSGAGQIKVDTASGDLNILPAK